MIGRFGQVAAPIAGHRSRTGCLHLLFVCRGRRIYRDSLAHVAGPNHWLGCRTSCFASNCAYVELPSYGLPIFGSRPPFSLSPRTALIRHRDELPWAAGLLGYGVDWCWIGYAPTGRGQKPPPSGSGGVCGDACRSTRDNRNPSTAGAPKSPCCSAGTASAYRSFGCPGNHHIWRRDRSTGRAAMRGGCGRRSDQSVTRTVVRSGRTPARTNSS